MSMLIRLMKTAITAVFLSKMPRGVIFGLMVYSMKRIIGPAIMMIAAILLSFLNPKKRGTIDKN